MIPASIHQTGCSAASITYFNQVTGRIPNEILNHILSCCSPKQLTELKILSRGMKAAIDHLPQRYLDRVNINATDRFRVVKNETNSVHLVIAPMQDANIRTSIMSNPNTPRNILESLSSPERTVQDRIQQIQSPETSLADLLALANA